MIQKKTPLVSIITVVYNNQKFIKDAIESVISQDYSRIEHIVIDGGSTDGTRDIIESYSNKISFYLSESDEGIYDALNKGIINSNGDILGILHSDDLFWDESVVSNVISEFIKTEYDLCFSDLVIIDKLTGKIIRYVKANFFRKWMLRTGFFPPHPTIFLKRSLFNEFGLFSVNYKLAGDFDFILRIFHSREINWIYLNRITVRMRNGGMSNSGISNKILCAKEIHKSLKMNKIFSPYFFQIGRYLIRIPEYFLKPSIKKNI